ncbi:DAK2 domain-containing protein [Mycobacterium sp. CVI_P3]|uniref:DAK2 domain-containing protein n=1 Tax=Mycobacterium pinniadriaticum TaxID=2994102 RepID=A0ABT3SCK8_9MYCO|nr:DAK2 domain-containing protein [Mycobacterium pinniadriaticum]MCX2930455.1 DAK2 domain-containing protein [Mycobacterium pinniadriaticum]MCX2936879.1 DAK2 domain-containing protein [Mycobacterium pinniadriaticum]
MPDRRLDASALRDWAHTAVGDLITHTDEINRLNVFPVADSDTGTNLLFTMRSALAAAKAAGSGDVSQMAAALSEGALHGARGNSGVILSQILRGLADVTASAAEDTDGALADIDAVLLGAALRHAVGLVVSSMGGELVAGTIVSVLQAVAEAIQHWAAEGAELAEALAAGGDAAVVALERTPEQLDVLAEAGVVDAGGRGLLVLVDALIATVTGHAPHRHAYEPGPPRTDSAAAEAAPPQFEVMYLLAGCGTAALGPLRERLEQLGESVAIAASAAGADRLSVHVHTDDAGAAVEAGLAVGVVSRIQISVLSAGSARVSPGSWSRERAVLAVVDGDGAAELFEQEGACILRPDAALADPVNAVTARELLRALVDTGAAQVMVLPNGYVAAEELVAGCTAGIGWGVDVVALPTGSMVQGLAALAVHDEGRQAVDDGFTMARAAAAARHGSVRTATEQALTWAGACEPGDGLGLAGDEVVVVADDVAGAASGLIDLLLVAGGELVTVLTGRGADPAVAEVLAEHVHRRHPGIEFATYPTGHRGDALLIGVE